MSRPAVLRQKRLTLEIWAETAWGILTVRPQTLRSYKCYFYKHIKPVMGSMPLDHISRRDVQAWVLTLPPTIQPQCLAIVKTLFREAVVYGLTDNNPTLGVRKRPYVKSPRAFQTYAELAANDYGRYNSLFRFLALHGLRWSEVQALQPSDVTDEYVSVTKGIHGPTKNRQTRLVPYMGYFNYPFPKSYKWARLAYQPYTLHSLRKTYAYFLKTSGVHVQVAQRLMGHSSIAVTYNLYTEVLPSEVDDAATLLRATLARH